METDTTVTSGFRKIIPSSGYAPSKASAISVRTVRQVVELDPVGFAYAVFLEGSYSDGSSSSVTGGVYTGGSMSLGNAHDYVGDLDAIGSISTGSNQTITGTLHANGSVSVSKPPPSCTATSTPAAASPPAARSAILPKREGP